MKKKVFIFTVGASLITNSIRNTSLEVDNSIFCDEKIDSDEFRLEVKKAVDFLKIKDGELDPEINLKLRYGIGKGNDKLSAELSTIYLYYEKYLNLVESNLDLIKPEDKDEGHFYFISTDTPEGYFCSKVLAEYFKEPLYLGKALNIKTSKERKIGKLNTKDGKLFKTEGLINLFNQLTEIITKHNDADDIYLVISGGFKSVLAFVSILGGIFPKTRLLYVYEFTPDLIDMDILPLNFDMLTWRDYRGILKILGLFEGKKENIGIFKTSEINSLVDALPANIKSLTTRSPLNEFKGLNPIGHFLNDKFQKIVEDKKLSQYGEGFQLLEILGKEKHRVYLEKRIKTWQHLWIGDKIPEMAEHQRGHTQRIQELAYPVMKALKLNEHEIITMILAIWLHDLGNSGDYFTLYPEFFKDNKEKGTFYVKGFPNLVREFHNFMSYTLMDSRGDMSEFLYGKKEEINIPLECIYAARIIGAYHRKSMPFPGGKAESYKVLNRDEFEITFTPEITFENVIKKRNLNEVIAREIDVMLLIALFRIIDASDTQLERSVDDEYIETRKELIKLEQNTLLKRIQLLDRSLKIFKFPHPLTNEVLFETAYRESLGEVQEKGELYRYIDRYNFIGSQPEHYKKHQLLSTVLILKSLQDSTSNKTVFNHISISLDDLVEIKDMENLIRKDFISEYNTTRKILNERNIEFRFYWYCDGTGDFKEIKET